MKRAGAVLILLLAFFGLADSAYLAQHAATGTPLICNIESLSGCNVVAQSPFARIFGIPLADFGLVFYGVLFAVAALELFFRNELIRRALQVIALIGLLASSYFVYVQVYRIGALCIYCLASAGIDVAVFLIATFLEPLRTFRFRRPRLREA